MTQKLLFEEIIKNDLTKKPLIARSKVNVITTLNINQQDNGDRTKKYSITDSSDIVA
jgi:hypothetical protein